MSYVLKYDVIDDELNEISSFLVKQNINYDYDKILLELQNLTDEIKTLFLSVPNEQYNKFLFDCASKVLMIEDEAQVLEIVVPMWSTERGYSVPSDKAIDEFYYELEVIIFWCLLLSMSRSTKLTTDIITKLRAIVRRYSKMPEFWKYLCAISGDQLTDAYTF